MIPIFQTLTDKDKGDCSRAVVASLFELDITQVPHFLLYDFPNDKLKNNKNEIGKIDSISVYWSFLRSIGWDFNGCGYPKDTLEKIDSVDGFFYAVVESRSFKNTTHAVVIDITGKVVHDPNPNQKWLNVNIKKSGDLLFWHLLSENPKEVS